MAWVIRSEITCGLVNVNGATIALISLYAITEAPVNIRHGRKCVCVGVFVVL